MFVDEEKKQRKPRIPSIARKRKIEFHLEMLIVPDRHEPAGPIVLRAGLTWHDWVNGPCRVRLGSAQHGPLVGHGEPRAWAFFFYIFVIFKNIFPIL